MKTRAEFDSRWDDNKTLKDNIINLFKMDFMQYAKPEVTGFFCRKQHEEIQEYELFRMEMLSTFESMGDKNTDVNGKRVLSLEDIYLNFRIIRKTAGGAKGLKYPQGQLYQMVCYVVDKMEQVVPALANDQELLSKLSWENINSLRSS